MMLKELTLWSHKLKEGSQLAHSFYECYGARISLPVTKIAFVGMGGSGIAGRIFKTFLDHRPGVITTIVDSSFVPAHVDTKTLVIIASYSGQTWETVDVLESLSQKGIPVIVLSHSGKTIQIAEQKNLPYALLPQSLTPRSALGHFLGFMGTFFELLGVLPGGAKMVTTWTQDAEKYVPAFIERSYFKDFLEVANGHETFHIWGVAGDSGAAAYRATTQFNENSKAIAVYNDFPELAHNLLVGFTNTTARTLILMFYTDFLPSHMMIALETISGILKEKRVVLYKPPILGDTFESQIFTMILWADFASYHLGHARGVDIERVQVIDELKSRQKSKGIT